MALHQSFTNSTGTNLVQRVKTFHVFLIEAGESTYTIETGE